MEVETSDYVSVINAARDEVSGMWLDEPEELQATPQSYDPAIILVLGKLATKSTNCRPPILMLYYNRYKCPPFPS